MIKNRKCDFSFSNYKKQFKIVFLFALQKGTPTNGKHRIRNTL